MEDSQTDVFTFNMGDSKPQFQDSTELSYVKKCRSRKSFVDTTTNLI